MHNLIKLLVVSITVIVGTIFLIVFAQQLSSKDDDISLKMLHVPPLDGDGLAANNNISQEDADNIIRLDDLETPLVDRNSKIVADYKIQSSHLNVPPVGGNNKTIPKFSKYSDVTEKKRAFFAYLQPEIQRQNNIVIKEREMVFALQDVFIQKQKFNKEEQKVFDKLAEKYHFTGDKPLTIEQTFETLIRRVDTIPVALILVQAANESGWGTSRFAQNGYNFFGLWCFKRGCGFVPKNRNEDSAHEVAKFRDLSHAVMTYIRNINRHYAYKDLRVIRQKLRQTGKPVTARALASGLSSYSERGQEYIDELLSMLRVNRKHMDIPG